MGWDSLTMDFTSTLFCIWLTILSCSGLILLTILMIRMTESLSTLDHSFGFACHQMVLKNVFWSSIFPLLD